MGNCSKKIVIPELANKENLYQVKNNIYYKDKNKIILKKGDFVTLTNCNNWRIVKNDTILVNKILIDNDIWIKATYFTEINPKDIKLIKLN